MALWSLHLAQQGAGARLGRHAGAGGVLGGTPHEAEHDPLAGIRADIAEDAGRPVILGDVEVQVAIGVEVELKVVDASVFFGGDAGSPDTFQKFYADVEMYANNFDGTDPEPYLAQYLCDKIPGPENQWQGENINRFCDPAYDALVEELSKTAEMSKRAESPRS